MIEEAEVALSVGILVTGDGNLHKRHMGRIESHGNVPQSHQALRQQRGSGDDDKGEAHLQDDEYLLELTRAPPLSSGPRPAVQGRIQVGTGRCQRWRESEEQG